jgi:hypothetical protein
LHATLHIGDALDPDRQRVEPRVLIEAQAKEGVIAVLLSKYASFQHADLPTSWPERRRSQEGRRMRGDESRQAVRFQADRRSRPLSFSLSAGPLAMRRRLLAIGSGDPTKAICSVLIVEAFQSIRHPILPERVTEGAKAYGVAPYVQSEIEHIRWQGLFTPARLRRLALFQRRQADHRRRLRLPRVDLGAAIG